MILECTFLLTAAPSKQMGERRYAIIFYRSFQLSTQLIFISSSLVEFGDLNYWVRTRPLQNGRSKETL